MACKIILYAVVLIWFGSFVLWIGDMVVRILLSRCELVYSWLKSLSNYDATPNNNHSAFTLQANPYFVYCIIAIIIDIWFIVMIFVQKQEKEFETEPPKSNKAIKSRWWIITLRVEKSPFSILTLYSVFSTIIAFALVFAFLTNVLMSASINTLTSSGDHFSSEDYYMYFILIVQIFSMAIFIYYLIIIAYSCVTLAWYNHGDACALFRIGKLKIITAHVWRGFHFLLTLSFVLIEFRNEISRGHAINLVNTHYQFRVVCRWLLFRGLIWMLTYISLSFLILLKLEPPVLFTLFYESYNFGQVTTDIPWHYIAFPIIMLINMWIAIVNYGKWNIIMMSLYFVYIGFLFANRYGPILSTTYYWCLGKYLDKHMRNNFSDYYQYLSSKKTDNKWRIMKESLPMFTVFSICIGIISIIIYQLYPEASYHSNAIVNEELCQYDSVSVKRLYHTHDKFKTFATYPICDYKFGNSADLNVLDLTLMTMVAYQDDKEKQKQILDLWFGKNQWGEYKHFQCNQNEEDATFFHISNEKHKYDIISIRGTKDQNDAQQDLRMFTEIASLQLMSFFIPLTTLLPDETLQFIISIISIGYQQYDDPVYEYVINNNVARKRRQYCKKRKSDGSCLLWADLPQNAFDPSYKLYLVGHSLGGGIAEIVAARLAAEGWNVKSFGVSSPGVSLSSKKFGFSSDNLDLSSISIIPRRDFVPNIDRHGGIKQLIQCNEKSFVHCHYASTSFMELLRSCPSEYIEVSNERREFAECIYIYKGISDCCLRN